MGTQWARKADEASALGALSDRADGYLPKVHKITVVTRAWKGKVTVT